MKVCFFMLGAVFGLEMTRPLSADEVNKCTDLNCLSDIVQDGEFTVSGKGSSRSVQKNFTFPTDPSLLRGRPLSIDRLGVHYFEEYQN